jgi:hypothetical protein
MKKVLCLVCVTGLIFTSMAYANSEESDCLGEYTSVDGKDYRHLHEHCYEDSNSHGKRKTPVGIGVDIPLVVKEDFDVINENKFDARNNEYSNFTVVKVKMDKGIFQKLIELIKGKSKE